MATSEHFFIVGAQRSGTTYLYRTLDEHPEIEMAKPVRPEPKFFLKSDLSGYTHDDYLRLFFGSKEGAKLRGEKSTSYIESERAARQISQWYPGARILFMLREPVARAISNYHFSRNNGLETLPLAQAIMEEDSRREDYDHSKISASPYAYTKRGFYINYIKMYGKYFARDRMIFVIHEEFIGQPGQVKSLYADLGVDPDFIPSALEKPANVSEKTSEQLTPELECYMTTYFVDSNARLEAHLGRPLTAWER